MSRREGETRRISGLWRIREASRRASLGLAVTLCSLGAAMAQQVVDRPDLELNESFVSPIELQQPIYACSESVMVRGFVPGATIMVFHEGRADPIAVNSDLRSGTDFHPVDLPAPLDAGQQIYAIQVFDAAASRRSNVVRVGSQTEAFPGGLPIPNLIGTPPLQCGRAIGLVNRIPGAFYTLFSTLPDENGIPGQFEAIGSENSLDYVVTEEAFELGAFIRVQSRICEDQPPSPFSDLHIVAEPPDTIAAPRVLEVPEGARIAVVDKGPGGPIAQGASLEVFAVDGGRRERIGGQATVGDRPQQVLIAVPAPEDGRHAATQALCEPSDLDLSVPVAVVPCSEQTAPTLARVPLGGADRIVLADYYPGARITVFADGNEIGDGSGPVVRVEPAIGGGQTIHVIQEFAGVCQAGLATEVVALYPASPLPPTRPPSVPRPACSAEEMERVGQACMVTPSECSALGRGFRVEGEIVCLEGTGELRCEPDPSAYCAGAGPAGCGRPNGSSCRPGANDCAPGSTCNVLRGFCQSLEPRALMACGVPACYLPSERKDICPELGGFIPPPEPDEEEEEDETSEGEEDGA